MTSLLRSTLALTLVALPLAAQAGPGPRGQVQRMARILRLTDEQKASIRAIHEKHGADMAARRESARQAQAALGAALQDPAAPEGQLRELHDRASAARFQMLLARRAVHQEVQAVLTPEQRAKAEALRDLARERRPLQERRGGGMPG